MAATLTQYGEGYSMYDLNNNDRTWEFSGCHASIIRAESSEKYIVSSSYPNVYSQYMNCEWRVQAPLGKQVKITFADFNIDNCGQAGIKMFDGKADSSNFKAEYCGSQAPADFVSGGNLVTMNVFQRQNTLGKGMAIMVGYSYVDNLSNQPSSKYHHGQPSSNNGNQSQDQLYDLLMSKLLDGAMPQAKPQPNPYMDYGVPTVVQRVPATVQRHQPKKTNHRKPAPRPKAKPQKKKPTRKPKTLNLDFNINGDGQIRDTYDELLAKKREEKMKNTAALKQKLILVIIGLIVIIGANVGFIYMRWKGEQEKAHAAGGADKDSGSDLESKVTDDNIYSSIGETYSTMNLQPQMKPKQNKAFAAMY